MCLFRPFFHSLISTLLEVFMTDNLENLFLDVLQKSGSFEVFLGHMPQAPVKVMEKGQILGIGIMV